MYNIRPYSASMGASRKFGEYNTFAAAKPRMYTLKKSLGQHFLHDERIAARIIEAFPVREGDRVLEVGPGGGALTQRLLALPGIDLRALEIDGEKVRWLAGQFPALETRLIHGDILKEAPPFPGPFAVIGNFPYNISSQILFRILEWRKQVFLMTGMFQREVARRIAAGPGGKEYGILSVLVQAFYSVEYLFEVPAACFTPPPAVVSAVIRLRDLGDPYRIGESKRFFSLVKAAFAQRRKMLRNPLKGLFPAALLQTPLFSRRAEELSVAEFVDLSKQML